MGECAPGGLHSGKVSGRVEFDVGAIPLLFLLVRFKGLFEIVLVLYPRTASCSRVDTIVRMISYKYLAPSALIGRVALSCTPCFVVLPHHKRR